MATVREARRREEHEIEFSRIIAFSDGVFAIAITLLVLNLNVPARIHGDDLSRVLWDQRQDMFAYAISFAVIGRFWIVHHRFFSDVTGFDGRLLALNLFYLAWIVLIPFSSQVLGDHGGDPAAIVLYSVNLSVVVLVGGLLFADARRRGLSKVSDEDAKENRRRAGFIAAIFLASIPVALIDGHVAQFLWLALFVPVLLGLMRRG
jgi:TMEM175 potassium channel family protein